MKRKQYVVKSKCGVEFGIPPSLSVAFGENNEKERDAREDIKKLRTRLGDNASLYSHSRVAQRLYHMEHSLERLRDFKNPISLTFTFIGPEKAVKKLSAENFNSLLHKVLKKCRVKKYLTGKETLECVAVHEYDSVTRPHIHAIFDIPKKLDEYEFIKIIASFWQNLGDCRTHENKSLRNKPCIYVTEYNSPERAVSYLFKEETKDKNEEFSTFILA